jgi:hypothetical protein
VLKKCLKGFVRVSESQLIEKRERKEEFLLNFWAGDIANLHSG